MTDYPLFDCMKERGELRAKVENREAEAATMRAALEGANELNQAQMAEIEQLEAQAAAMREALADIVRWPETDFDRDNILTICQNALAADAGSELPERLRRAERMLELLEAAGHVSPETVSQTRNIVLSYEKGGRHEIDLQSQRPMH